MTKRAKKSAAKKTAAKAMRKRVSRVQSLAATDEDRFADVVALIEAARNRAYQAVNAELVALYWQLGAYLSQKIDSAEWGDGVVDELAAVLAQRYPGLRGFTRRNLFRMRQF